MTIVTKQPGESDEAFRRRAFAANRDPFVAKPDEPLRVYGARTTQPSTAPMWGQGVCAAGECSECVPFMRTASPMPLRTKAPKVSLRWHALAVLAVVMTVSAGVWFLS
jgi:hypothetical protein